jgi:uncharacterized protein (TIGR03067 family)
VRRLRSRSVPAWLTVLLGLATPTALLADDKPKQNEASLAGTWKVVAESVDGEDVPADVAAECSLVITKDALTMRGGLAKQGDTFVATPTRTIYRLKLGDKTIDLSPRQGRAVPGLYEVKGDELTLCLGFAGERPKELSSKGGEGFVLMKCKREKP